MTCWWCPHLGGDANGTGKQQAVVLVVSNAGLQLPRVVQSLPGSAGADGQMPHASIRVHARQLAQTPEVRRKQREAACLAM